jgi:virginiamycin B lyase
MGRSTPTGTVIEFSPGLIAAGPDGNPWFTEQLGNRVGRITPTGTVTEFSAALRRLPELK